MSARQFIQRFLRHPVVVLPLVVTLIMIAQVVGSIAVAFFLPNVPSALKLACITAIALVVLGGTLFVAMHWLGATWKTFKLGRPSKGWLKTLLATAGIYVLFSWSLLVAVAFLFPSFNSTQAQDVGLQNPSGWQLLPGFLALVVLTPVFEEIVFRGILFTGLRRKSKFIVAALISAVVFAFLHGQWNVAIDTFALGLALAYLVEKTDSIVPGMMLHALKNAIAFSALFILK